jgi:hypothetical protein
MAASVESAIVRPLEVVVELGTIRIGDGGEEAHCEGEFTPDDIALVEGVLHDPAYLGFWEIGRIWRLGCVEPLCLSVDIFGVIVDLEESLCGRGGQMKSIVSKPEIHDSEFAEVSLAIIE